MADETTDSGAVQQADEDSQALLFELENVAIAGRKIVYDVHKSLFADRDVELTPAMFMRFCLQGSPEVYLEGLLNELDKKRLSASKLASEISEGVRLSLEDTGVKIAPAVGKLFKKASASGIALGALSATTSAVADRISERLGLKDMGITIFSIADEGRDAPTADSWLKLGKQMSISHGRCTAIATGLESCKAALSAGMRTIVIPDEYTVFQDFSGADLVVEGGVDKALKDIMSVVIPA